MPSQIRPQKAQPTPTEENAEINRRAIEHYREYRRRRYEGFEKYFIPTVSEYRKVGIEDHRPEIIQTIVRPCIDEVLATSDPNRLKLIERDIRWAPEARTLAACKRWSLIDLSVERRTRRPDFEIDDIKASLAWMDFNRQPTSFQGDCAIPPPTNKSIPPHRRQSEET